MSQIALTPELWEQALVNGRRVHPSDGAKAVTWAEDWYGKQGGQFKDQAVQPVKAPEPEPVAIPEIKVEANEAVTATVEESSEAAPQPKRTTRKVRFGA